MSVIDFKLENILFIDLETVPQNAGYDSLPEKIKHLWDKKAKFLYKDDENQTSDDIYRRAGIYAEFGKIICISVGTVYKNAGKTSLRLKSYYGDNEKKILQEFILMLKGFGTNRNITLAAHNGKEFDFPYLARRIIINGLKLPDLLQVSGKKPWEVPFIDTMELWKFGDYKHYTSLELLTNILNIPTPKDDMDGSMVAEVYYKEKDLKRIVEYCEKDVIAVAQVCLKFRQEDIIPTENIKSVTFEKE